MFSMSGTTPATSDFYPYDEAIRIKEELSDFVGLPFRFTSGSPEKHILVLIQVVPCRDHDLYRLNLVAQGAFLTLKDFCDLNEIEIPGIGTD
ncbi:MAG: hypothetical protein EOO09_12660 [Chitinophagaceae bacterium]|nr:MAG: hypothetical protein EOO09_12660 [Chitinophagaceae bacterium]